MSKLPTLDVFILIDTSGSMIGEPISMLNQAVNYCIEDLAADWMDSRRIRLCIFTYNDTIEEIRKLIPISAHPSPVYLGVTQGLKHSGKALEHMAAKIRMAMHRYPANPDLYRLPLFFFITDGCPTDTDCYAQSVLSLSLMPVRSIGFGLGEHAALQALKAVSNHVIALRGIEDQSSAKIGKLFSSLIMFYLDSDDEPDLTRILDPTNPGPLVPAAQRTKQDYKLPGL